MKTTSTRISKLIERLQQQPAPEYVVLDHAEGRYFAGNPPTEISQAEYEALKQRRDITLIVVTEGPIELTGKQITIDGLPERGAK